MAALHTTSTPLALNNIGKPALVLVLAASFGGRDSYDHCNPDDRWLEGLHAAKVGRNPDAIHFACCLPIEVSENPLAQEEDRLRGDPDQLAEALMRFRDIGVEHIALQFMVPHWPERQAQIERFAREVMPALQQE